VIIHDFDVLSPGVCPTKAESELIVYSDTVLARAISLQSLQSIPRRHSEIRQAVSDLKLSKLAPSHSCDVGEPRDAVALRKSLRVDALERLDHPLTVTCRVITVNYCSS
jgi:hypothetical protein